MDLFLCRVCDHIRTETGECTVAIDFFVSGITWNVESTIELDEVIAHGNTEIVDVDVVVSSIAVARDSTGTAEGGNVFVESHWEVEHDDRFDWERLSASNDEMDDEGEEGPKGEEEEEEVDDESRWTPTQVSNESLRIISDLQQQSGGHEHELLQAGLRWSSCDSNFSW